MLAFEQSDWQASLQASARAVEHFQAAGAPAAHRMGAILLRGSRPGAPGSSEEFDRLIGEAIANFRQEHDDMGLGYRSG